MVSSSPSPPSIVIVAFAVAGGDEVIAAERKYEVVAGAGIDCVNSVRAGDVIGTGCSGDDSAASDRIERRRGVDRPFNNCRAIARSGRARWSGRIAGVRWIARSVVAGRAEG